MLPLNRRIGRDWMMILCAVVWTTVILIMFLSKLKTQSDILGCAVLALLFLLVNADNVVGRYHFYKVLLVLRPALKREAIGATLATAAAAALEVSSLELAPGWVYPAASFVLHCVAGWQCHPAVTVGVWMGSRNLMTKKQACFYCVAQALGALLGATSFAFAWSIRHELTLRDALPSVVSLAEMILGCTVCFGVAYGRALLMEPKKHD